MSKFWWTSDLHFKHRRIVELTNRGQETTAENHEEWLIDLWNSTVDKSDCVIHLGDFCFGKNYEGVDILNKLNGHKILIKGNHDNSDAVKKYSKVQTVMSVREYYEHKYENQDVVMFHFPISAWHKQHRGSWHLHGHCHGSFQGEGKILDVGLDNSYNLYGQHKFFDFEMIKEFMSNREVKVADHHVYRKGEQ